MKSIFEQNGGTYTKIGKYDIPNVSVPDTKKPPLNHLNHRACVKGKHLFSFVQNRKIHKSVS